MAKTERADLVVVGAGMVGGWASWFAATSGAERVVVLEKDLAGQGASSRAAGVVRAQGGTPATVALGRFSIDFYRSQQARLGTDSGFRELGYLILAVTQRDVRDGNARVEMQRDAGLDVRWVDAQEACALNPTLADGRPSRRQLLRDGRRDRSAAERPRVLARDAAGRRAAPRADAVPRVADRGRARRAPARHRRADARRRDRHRTRAPDGRTVAARGRQAGRRADLRGRRAPPGGRDRAASGVRRRTPADGLRRGRRHLLAPGGGRTALGDVQPEGDARARARGRLAVPAAHGTPPAQAGAGHARTRHPQGVVRHDRLHAGPPADPGSGASPPRACRSTGRRSPHPAGTG